MQLVDIGFGILFCAMGLGTVWIIVDEAVNHFDIHFRRRFPKDVCQSCNNRLPDQARYCDGGRCWHKGSGFHRSCHHCDCVNFFPKIEDVKARIRAQEIEDAQSEVEALLDEEKRKERARVN